MVTRAPRSATWPALWVVLMVMLAIPIPLRGIPMPERGVPILYLIVAGSVLLFLRIARASVPLSLLLAYMLFHVLVGGYAVRGIQILFLLTIAGLLYLEAMELSRAWAERVGWALVAGACLQAFLGTLNIFHLLPSPTMPALALRWVGINPAPVFKFFDSNPWLTMMNTDFVGRPMGWLTHPNYWGSFMALAVPAVYVLCGRWAGLLAMGAVCTSGSIGPVISAAAGLLIVAWRDLSGLLKPALVAACALIIVSVSIAHIEPRLDGGKALTLSTASSGRTDVWAAAWPYVREHLVLGNGTGSWRLWAGEYNRAKKKDFATDQAHNEPLQLLFELGLIGVALGAAWLYQVTQGAWLAWRLHDRLAIMWAAVAAAALVNSLGSPTFHLPAQAAIALFAAGRLEAVRRGA